MANFGIACSRIGMDPAGIGDYLTFPELNVLELPWEAVGTPVQREAEKRNWKIICGSIADARISATFLSAGKKVRETFSAQIRKAVAYLAEHKIHTAALDCPAADILADAEAHGGENFRDFLQDISPALAKHDFTLLLPHAIPAENSPEEVMRLLRNTMLPGIKLNLNIFPWQIPPRSNPRELTGRLGYETRVMTFRYDADSGQHIQRNHLEKWLKILPAPADILIAPFSLNNRMTFMEAEHFSGFVQDMLEKTELERHIGTEPLIPEERI